MNLVWFRNDLRVDDNPALYQAMEDNAVGTVAVYLLCQQQWDIHGVGVNRRAMIIQALKNLRSQLDRLNVPLLILDAKSFAKVPKLLASLCTSLQVSQLFFNLEHAVNERQRDKQVVEQLNNQTKCIRTVGQSLTAPWEITNQEGGGYKVFSAFARRVYRLLDQSPLVTYPVPEAKSSANRALVDNALSIQLPKIQPSIVFLPDIAESSVLPLLDEFLQSRVQQYAHQRDFPAISGTSKLSTALAVGSLSVRRCYQQAKKTAGNQATSWINELIWRDFYRAVMWHFPKVSQGQAFHSVDRIITWLDSPAALTIWQNGQTGIPIVDAAMKQLVETGWMHNRLRMIVASYLSKNLFMDWRHGEAFFAEHLVDYDFASNNGGWQWCASVGTDAAPYFRVFNPAAQQKKFDPDATFIKRWLPQLANFSARAIHQFEKTPLAGYYSPQVDLKQTRQFAIEQFKLAKAG